MRRCRTTCLKNSTLPLEAISRAAGAAAVEATHVGPKDRTGAEQVTEVI